MTCKEKQYVASAKYKAANIKRVPLDVPNKEYDVFRSACDAHGEKVNTVLRRAMAEYVSANNAIHNASNSNGAETGTI